MWREATYVAIIRQARNHQLELCKKTCTLDDQSKQRRRSEESLFERPAPPSLPTSIEYQQNRPTYSRLLPSLPLISSRSRHSWVRAARGRPSLCFSRIIVPLVLSKYVRLTHWYETRRPPARVQAGIARDPSGIIIDMNEPSLSSLLARN